MSKLPGVFYAVFFVVLFICGFFAGTVWGQSTHNTQLNSQLFALAEENQPHPQAIYNAQIASVNGQITKLDDNTATVLNNKGEIAQFPLSTHFVINQGSNTSVGTNRLPLNTPLTINFTYTPGGYQIDSVNLTP